MTGVESHEMRVLAIVPARSGSKGVPHKNIHPLADRPLLAWAIAACLRTPAIYDVVVSTDSADYARVARRHGASIPFLRPTALAGDDVEDGPVLLHTLDEMVGPPPDLIALIRPTTPLRDPAVMSQAILELSRQPECTALRSVHRMSETAFKAFRVDRAGHLITAFNGSPDIESANAPRQSYPPTFVANGYIDLVRPAAVRAGSGIYGTRVLAFETPPVSEVDEPADLRFLDWQVAGEPAHADRLFGEVPRRD